MAGNSRTLQWNCSVRLKAVMLVTNIMKHRFRMELKEPRWQHFTPLSDMHALNRRIVSCSRLTKLHIHVNTGRRLNKSLLFPLTTIGNVIYSTAMNTGQPAQQRCEDCRVGSAVILRHVQYIRSARQRTARKTADGDTCSIQ